MGRPPEIAPHGPWHAFRRTLQDPIRDRNGHQRRAPGAPDPGALALFDAAITGARGGNRNCREPARIAVGHSLRQAALLDHPRTGSSSDSPLEEMDSNY